MSLAEIIAVFAGTLLGIFGLIYSVLSYRAASRADVKSAMNYDILVENNLVYRSLKGNFSEIYKECLIDPMTDIVKQNLGEDTKIQLLLSTPAYGFGVIEPSEFKKYMDRLGECARRCHVEMILHSPELHWLYWANILVWSASRDLIERGGLEPIEGETDAIRFAEGVCHFDRAVHDAPEENFRLWLGNNVHVRLYAYRIAKDKAETLLYAANTDAISLMFPQFGKHGFQAVASRIAAHSIELFINAPTSQFERQKFCHYLNDFDSETGPITGQVSQSELRPLLRDYVFGRTTYRISLPHPVDGTDYLDALVDVILKKTKELLGLRTTAARSLTKGEMTKAICQHVLSYFSRISRNNGETLFGSNSSPAQRGVLRAALEEFCGSSGSCYEELYDEAGEHLGRIDPKTLESNPHEKQRLLSLLHGLLTSGAGLSNYGNSRVNRAASDAVDD